MGPESGDKRTDPAGTVDGPSVHRRAFLGPTARIPTTLSTAIVLLAHDRRLAGTTRYPHPAGSRRPAAVDYTTF